MDRSVLRFAAGIGISIAIVWPGIAIGAQPYPSKPIRLVVPFAPGGGNDILARLIAQRLLDTMGQPVVVDNRGGAGGIIGAEMIASAPADGYTLGMGSTSTLAINPSLYKKLRYDPIRDFSPITLIGSAPYLLVAHPSVPVHSVRELIALAKARPGTLHFSSSGNGTTNHLAGEMFKSAAGVDLVHVPYKGAGPALIDALSGQIQLTFGPIMSALPYVRSGQFRALGVTSQRRSSVAPDLPTIAESGLPGYEVINWYGIVVPAGTPRSIIDRVNGEIVQIIQSRAVRDRLSSEGAEVIGNTPEAFAAFIRAELTKWGKAIKDARVAAD